MIRSKSVSFLNNILHVSSFNLRNSTLVQPSKCFSTSNTFNKEVKKYEPPSTSAATASGKLRRPPFGKDLFLGLFDTEVLSFPEVLERERLDTLEEMVAPLKRFFTESVDSKKIDVEAKIPKETLDGLKQLGLFGQQIPVEYGGLGLNATEYARIGEVTALDGSIAVTLAAHQSIGLKGLLISGNDTQKAKYLPKLATGEWTAAFCLTEPSSGSDAASIQTRAKLSEDENHWILNGSKIWISNGGIADFFTVFAKTEVKNREGKLEDRVTAFLVERDFGGISHGKPEDKLGIRGSNTCQVYFENVAVPKENVLGDVGEGFKIAMKILNSGRFSMGSSGAGIMKKLMGLAVEHAVTRKQFGKRLMDFELMQEKFAQLATTVYAMESMAYLTAGMLDSYEEPDCALEAAIVKVFSSEAVWNGTSECLQILGGLGYMKDYPYERFMRDSRIMLIFEGTNEILRMFIALTGLQHAGKGLAEVVKRMRNPLMNPNLVVKKAWERFSNKMSKPRLVLHLEHFLHPSLAGSAKQLETCVMRFQYATEIILERHGKLVVNKQMDLRRIADAVIDIYAMTAVLGRASRSYCIGLQNAEHEVHLATSFCADANERVSRALDEILGGEIVTQDLLRQKIASKIFDGNGYCAEHPLKRIS